MTEDERKRYLTLLLADAQKARSISREALGDIGSDIGVADETVDRVLEQTEPWLFGKKCIILPLSRCIDNGPTDGEVANFAYIARSSPMLTMEGIMSGREDPGMKDVFTRDIGWSPSKVQDDTGL